MKFLNILAVLAALVSALVTWWAWSYNDAQQRAQAFCDAVPIGSDVSDVVARAADIPEFRRGYRDERTRYVVSFQGPPYNACSCDLALDGDHVAARAVKWLDD